MADLTATCGSHKTISFLMPWKCLVVFVILPVKRLALFRRIPDLIHGLRIKQAAIDHYLFYRLCILNIVKRIIRQYDQICQFSNF